MLFLILYRLQPLFSMSNTCTTDVLAVAAAEEVVTLTLRCATEAALGVGGFEGDDIVHVFSFLARMAKAHCK